MKFGGDRGLILGCQISQLLSLNVLDPLDHLIKQKFKIKHYVRYMDDFIIIHKDKKFLLDLKTTIQKFVNNYGLSLNKKFSLSKLKTGFIFLKYKFYLTDSGKVKRIYLKRRIYEQKRRFKKLLCATQKINDKEIRLNTIFQHINSFLETIKKSDSAKTLIPKMTKWYQNQLKEINIIK